MIAFAGTMAESKRFDTKSPGCLEGLFNFLALNQRLQMPKMIAYRKHSEGSNNTLSKVLHISSLQIWSLLKLCCSYFIADSKKAWVRYTWLFIWLCKAICVEHIFISVVGVKVEKPKNRSEKDEAIPVGAQTAFVFMVKAGKSQIYVLVVNWWIIPYR